MGSFTNPTLPRRRVAAGQPRRTALEHEREMQHEVRQLQVVAARLRREAAATHEPELRDITRICRVVDGMRNPALILTPLSRTSGETSRRDFVIEYFNRAAAESSGWTEVELLGRRLSRVYLADVCRGVDAAYSAHPGVDEIFAWRGHPWVVDESGRMRRVDANLCALRLGGRLLVTWARPTDSLRPSPTDLTVRLGLAGT